MSTEFGKAVFRTIATGSFFVQPPAAKMLHLLGLHKIGLILSSEVKCLKSGLFANYGVR